MASTDVLVHINMNGNEIQNVLAQKLASAPSNPSSGQFYYNTNDNTLYVYNGTSWVNALSQGLIYSEGNGIDITNSTISIDLASGASAGNVTLSATSNGLSASVADASTTAKGIIEIATDTEASTGTATDLAVTPKQLGNKVDKLTTKPTAGDYTKVTINTEGQVTTGTTLSASDIPSLTLSKISDVTANASEVNILDGATLSTTELNYVDGVTSNIQTQLDSKLAKKPDGTNDLIDSGNKITLTYVPDILLGQMLYAGTFAPSTAIATLSTNAKTKLGTSSDTITLTNNTTAITGYTDNEGNYYLCSGNGTFASIDFITGDWLLSTGSGWSKVDNTDAVTGVKGNAESTYRIGNINITADNVLPTQSSNSGKFLTTDGTNCSWGTVPDTLPTQTGNNGKFLTTNGTTPSWDVAVTPSSTNTLTNKTIDADDNTISDLTTSNLKSGVLQTTIRKTDSASDSALATEKAIATALFNQAVNTYIVYNPALTTSNGTCTWTTNIFTSPNYSYIVQVFKITGEFVLTSTNAQIPTGTIPTPKHLTIKINSSVDIAADTYYALIIRVKG